MESAVEFSSTQPVRRTRRLHGEAEWLAAGGRCHADAMSAPQAGGPHRFALKLAHEVHWAVKNGTLNRLVLERDPESSPPMPPQAFLTVMEAFNRVMGHLHRRFPQLRTVGPPNLSQNDLGARTALSLGTYNRESSTMEFTNPFSIHWARHARDVKTDSQMSPKLKGFEGIVLHEYAHHLCSEKHSNRPRRLSRLAAMLKENGFIDDESKIDGTPAFAAHIGKQAREMGLGYHAGKNAEEFAAEALAWRLSPGYGSSVDVPAMPGFLENWVHECFPFTRDAPQPDRFFAFDPAGIGEPWMKDGQLQWRNRGPVPAPPARSLSIRPQDRDRPPKPPPRPMPPLDGNPFAGRERTIK